MELLDALKKFATERARDLKRLATTDLTMVDVEAKVAGQTVRFRANVERVAAWELYVELNTRVATESLGESEGLLREALDSLHGIFAVTREILKKAGPGVADGDESLGKYALAILNRRLRPVLAMWHPELRDWEARRPAERSIVEHERAWPRAGELREDLGRMSVVLRGYSEALGLLAGIEEAPATPA